MPYFAAALAQQDDEWRGVELDLDGVDSLEQLVQRAAEELEAERVCVLIEADDWFGIAELAEDEEPRAYVSDAFEAAATAIGEMLVSEFGEIDEDEEEPEVPSGPLGESGLLSELGLAATDLELIATKTGLTPLDAVGEIADRIGAGAALEDMR